MTRKREAHPEQPMEDTLGPRGIARHRTKKPLTDRPAYAEAEIGSSKPPTRPREVQ